MQTKCNKCEVLSSGKEETLNESAGLFFGQ